MKGLLISCFALCLVLAACMPADAQVVVNSRHGLFGRHNTTVVAGGGFGGVAVNRGRVNVGIGGFNNGFNSGVVVNNRRFGSTIVSPGFGFNSVGVAFPQQFIVPQVQSFVLPQQQFIAPQQQMFVPGGGVQQFQSFQSFGY